MFCLAGVAQLVEQLIRNQQVRGSSPRAGSKILKLHGERHDLRPIKPVIDGFAQLKSVSTHSGV